MSGRHHWHSNRDHRNEGWSFSGSGVSRCWHAWDNDDDTKFCISPSHKGRACVAFPLDMTDVPEGAVITSVTVFIRVKRDSSSRSITVNLVCKDDTSRFTSRTIYPTTVIKTYEIGTYKTDPRGKPWDRHRLNQLLCQCFSYSRWFDGCRVYKLWVVVNYHVRPTVTVQQPTGTVTTPTPTLSWTYSQEDGDPQKKAEWKVFTAVQQSATSFNPETTNPVIKGHVNGDITSLVFPSALTPNAYYVYVKAESTFKAKSVWVGRAFTVQGVAPGIPGGDSEPGGAGGGAGFVSVIADPVTASAYLTLRDGSNLMSVQEADFETLTDGHGYTATNCVLADDTSIFYSAGGGSLKMTASSAAAMTATSPFIAVAANTPVTGTVAFKAAATARNCTVGIQFYDQDFVSSGDTITETDAQSAVTSWQTISATGTTPPDTAWARVTATVNSPANAEVHNIDAVGLMYGSGSIWSHGGHMSRNLLSAMASNAESAVNQPSEPWVNHNTATTYARVSTSGTGADGSNKFRLTYTGFTPTLAFVATGTVFSDTSSGTGYTLNKPAGVVDNDLLIAFVASTEHSTTPLEVPTGWELVNTASLNNGSDDIAFYVLKRTALTADPSSWVGNFGATSSRRRAVVVAYRGAANAALQFLAENVTTSASGVPNVQSATVSNTDPGAWRIAAFAVRDNAGSGAMTANIQAPVATFAPPIIFVGKATVWSTTSTNLSYTINKPSGVVSGDLMIASVCFNGSQTTVTAPSGWDLVRKTTSIRGDGGISSGSVTLVVFKRTAGSSEPNSWTGTHSNPGKPKISQAAAYRNCLIASSQFISESGASGLGSKTMTTGSVTNNDSRAWRISVFGAVGDIGSDQEVDSTEKARRSDDSTALSNSPDPVLAMFDSNGPIATGSYTRQGTLENSPYRTASWIGVLKPVAIVSPPAPPANETERSDSTTGSSDPWLTTGIYDTNGAAPLGIQSVVGIFAPGTTVDASASWIGIIRQASPIVAGDVEMKLVSPVDIADVDPYVRDLAGNMVTLQASFIGSDAGTPYLSLDFYNANELIQSQVAEGTAYNATTWTASSMTVPIPANTTRIGARLKSTGRAVSDTVSIDRVSLSFGSATVYRAGTGRTAHPIWNLPLIEYTDDFGDGYGDWRALPATAGARLVYDQQTGLTQFIDQTIVPLGSRKYRARTLSYGLEGDQFVSPYGPESQEVTGVTTNWWLKDLTDPTNSMELVVKADPLDVGTTNTTSVFQPLGADYPIVVSEGYKGDVIEITAIVRHSEFAKLQGLLRSGKTLYLQSNIDNAWWVRPVGDLQAQTLLTGKRKTDPIRFVKLAFVQVDVVA